MHQDGVSLTMKDILEKDFKIDTRGYRMQEVDEFLDNIIRDYNSYENIISNLKNENQKLNDEVVSLRQELRILKSNIETVKGNEKEITNVDLLRRISHLENVILGKESE